MHLGRPTIIASHVLLGDEPALIDPGPGSTLPQLEAGLAAHGLALGDLRTILLTHIHLDHAGATGAIVARNPHVHVYVHQRGAPHIINPERLMRSASRLYGDQMDILWGQMFPVPEERITTLAGGETLRLGGRTLRVYDSPGHASHHVIYVDEQSGAAAIGDNGGIRLPGFSYISPATPPPEIDLEAWAGTLDLLERLRPAWLLLTHFGPFADPAAHIAAYREVLARWSAVVREGLERGASEEETKSRLMAIENAILADDDSRARYQQASPIDLNYAGLARYWRKQWESRE
jgi:glyoxylase-like metal-dependent hydrolase (beta-lactamase superfamily II)